MRPSPVVNDAQGHKHGYNRTTDWGRRPYVTQYSIYMVSEGAEDRHTRSKIAEVAELSRRSGQAVVRGVVPSPPPKLPSFLSRIGFSDPTACAASSVFVTPVPGICDTIHRLCTNSGTLCSVFSYQVLKFYRDHVRVCLPRSNQRSPTLCTSTHTYAYVHICLSCPPHMKARKNSMRVSSNDWASWVSSE